MAGAEASISFFAAPEGTALFLNRSRLIAGDGVDLPPLGAQILMKEGTAQKVSNAILSGAAGVASFIFSLAAFLYIKEWDAQIIASVVAGAFCLLISYIAS